MKRIICIGNPYIIQDSGGSKVYERLKQNILPDGIELIHGGLAGLGLLKFIEDADRVIFIDQVCGFSDAKEVILINASEIASMSEDRYGHSSGLPYLLKTLPYICEGKIPDIFVVGIQNALSVQAIDEAAFLALKILTQETCDKDSIV
ncbi:MAG: hydrogenase maturation protease [Candidatus Brocadiae bacterium]|nr:hydrogenase maturation protease [Candidatus Brocadiia bacterium]